MNVDQQVKKWTNGTLTDDADDFLGCLKMKMKKMRKKRNKGEMLMTKPAALTKNR